MSDDSDPISYSRCLFNIASTQHGFFTRQQAKDCGVSRQLLRHHANTSRFQRIHRGVYRIRDYPSYMREEVVAAWLAVGKDVAVISHESALELHDLSDVIPYQVHLTVPRSIRNHPKLAGVKIHTTMRGLGSKEIVQREGMSVTSETRSIVDAAETGTGPEQIEMAVYQALRRGVTTGEELSAATRGRSKRTQQLIERAVEIAQSS